MAYGAILGQKIDIPIGVIVLWSGNESNIPVNWALCNGTNGTPDLRNQFVVGAGSTYDVGDTGGEATHTLTVNEMPTHTHTNNFSINLNNLSTSTAGAHIHTLPQYVGNAHGDYGTKYSTGTTTSGYTTKTSSDGNHTHTISGEAILEGTLNNTGNSQSHNNLPPYYALCYIMKIA